MENNNTFVRVSDILNLINTPNRGTEDYFIIDQIEALCNSNKTIQLNKMLDDIGIDDIDIERN